METENRLATAGLNQQLRSVRSFSFFQLANLLQRFATLHNAIEDTPIQVRYRAMPSLAFPAADVDYCAVHPVGYQQFLDVTVTFMGLFGPASPLPAFYTERVIQAVDQESPSRDLMDVFNHRCISLLQSCWEKYRYYTQYQANGSDQYTRWLLSLLGIDPEQLSFVSSLRWHKLLPFAGLLSNNVCSADVLCKIVAAYFELSEVTIEPWGLRTISIAEDQCNRMGMMNCQLAEDLVLGETVSDYAGKFSLRLPDLSEEQYARFLPDGSEFQALVELVRFVLKDPLEFDIYLECQPTDQAVVGLGDLQGRLGWSFFVGESDISARPCQTVICVQDFQNF